MQVGLVTPPGLLGRFVERALSPADHTLVVAPDLEALFSQASGELDLVLFAPLVDGRPAEELLREAAREARPLPQVAYLGLDSDRCRAATEAGFAWALPIPFRAEELLSKLSRAPEEPLHVLLCDDSALIHRHTVPILAGAGYRVSEAWDGAEGLELARTLKPHLVLSDVEMPKLDGYSLCTALKSDPATSSIPVVLCTSLGQAQDLERGFDAGADDYLVKPVVEEELLTRLHGLLAVNMVSVRERVLVVDDSPMVRHLISDCLKRQGFRVECALDGQEGLERALESPPDLILTDYDMPRMSGFDLVVGLKREERTRDLPVVMLSARDSERDQAQMRAAGLTSYLVKPFTPDKCIAIVERVLAELRLKRYKERSRLYMNEGAVRSAEELSRSAELGEIRAREVDATLLFSDISGFTNMSSKMTPAEVVAVLNESFDELCIAIQREGGDIDKFIGDAIMAVFEDRPEFDESHAVRAARAAWGMQRALEAFNARRAGQDASGHGPAAAPLVMRIGLNCGKVVRGDIGSRHVRRDYTCIGDVVNRAQRHEAKCPLGGVLLSAELYDRIRDQVLVERMDGITLKGIDTPVSAYVLKGFRLSHEG